jgi:hypothetical protein
VKIKLAVTAPLIMTLDISIAKVIAEPTAFGVANVSLKILTPVNLAM